MTKIMLLWLAFALPLCSPSSATSPFATSSQSHFFEALQQYAGIYRVNGIGTAMKVWVEEERLYTDLGQKGIFFELVQDQDLQFSVQFSGSQTQFTLTFEQKDKQITAFKLAGPGEEDLHCLKVEE